MEGRKSTAKSPDVHLSRFPPAFCVLYFPSYIGLHYFSSFQGPLAHRRGHCRPLRASSFLAVQRPGHTPLQAKLSNGRPRAHAIAGIRQPAVRLDLISAPVLPSIRKLGIDGDGIINRSFTSVSAYPLQVISLPIALHRLFHVSFAPLSHSASHLAEPAPRSALHLRS